MFLTVFKPTELLKAGDVQEAMRHSDKLGAGAKKRKKLHGKKKVDVVMKEWERGTLHSGSGDKVPKTQEGAKQAYAIAMSEAGMSRKARAKGKAKKSLGVYSPLELLKGK